MASIQIGVDFGGLAKVGYYFMGVTERLNSERLARRLAQFALFRIRARTARGVDYRDHLFRPYSLSWAKVRLKAGRGISTVNLFFYGHMFAAMTWRAIAGGAELFFAAPAEQAKAIENTELGRTFFALSNWDEYAMVEDVQRVIRGTARL